MPGATPTQEVFWRGFKVRESGQPLFIQDHQAMRIAKGERLQQNLIHQAEGRRIGSNAKRQSEDRHRCEFRTPDECPRGITEVLLQPSREIPAPTFSELLLSPEPCYQTSVAPQACLIRREAGLPLLVAL